MPITSSKVCKDGKFSIIDLWTKSGMEGLEQLQEETLLEQLSAAEFSEITLKKNGIIQLPYAHRHNPRLVYFLPHFSLRLIIKNG